MIQLPEGFDSMFRYITVVSQRAEQLITGAKPRAESRHKKFTLIAQDEVDAGLVSWRILTPEELEAQRQAMVEQFRTEVGAEVTPRTVRDVLPTSGAAGAPEEEVEVEPEGEIDELARLQRLLGIRGPAESAPGLEADGEEAAEATPRSASFQDEEDETSLSEDGDYEPDDEEDEDGDTLDLDDDGDDEEDQVEDYGGGEDDDEED